MDATVWISLAGLASTVTVSGIGFYFTHKAIAHHLSRMLFTLNRCTLQLSMH